MLVSPLMLLLLAASLSSFPRARGFSPSPPRCSKTTTTTTTTTSSFFRASVSVEHDDDDDRADDDDSTLRCGDAVATRRSAWASFAFASATAWSVVGERRPARAETGRLRTAQFAASSSSNNNSNKKVDPRVAYEGVLAAREELAEALRKRSVDAVRDYLERDAANMAAFESNAASLVASKRLSDEDKKTIGTIRRYGVAADVVIMYGGALAELDEANDEPDPAVVRKYLTRAKESIDEVIAVCRSSGNF